jgi:SulP family sulfate permease
MRFVSKSVMTGFVNALAILIFMAQLPELIGVPWLTYVMVAAGLAIIYLFPLITTAIPSPLVTIVVLTAITWFFGFDLRTVGDMGALPDTLPVFLIPDIPLNLETLWIILPYSVAVAAVGLLESLMTQTIVDDLTDTSSNRNMECVGQGIANTATGFIGGMAGCAMIGQSIINVKSGGRGRLSTFVAGAMLLFFIVVLGDSVARIPMAALVAIMIMVSIGTFSWSSIKSLRYPSALILRGDAGDRAVRGLHPQSRHRRAGRRAAVGHLLRLEDRPAVRRPLDAVGRRPHPHLHRRGQLFFASADDFMQAFDFREVLDKVVIDVSRAHIWDISSVAALDMAVLEIPPRRRRSGDHRHERGIGNHRRPAGNPRQAGRDGQADIALRRT